LDRQKLAAFGETGYATQLCESGLEFVLQVAFASARRREVPFFDVATRHYLLKMSFQGQHLVG
jgi:hypothetical protein